jgi:Fur family iron response transcriptional regulator
MSVLATGPSSANDQDQPARIDCQLMACHCTTLDVSNMLRDAGMRLTRQRIALGRLLYAAGDRHLTAEMLHEEANRLRIPVSLATVYNTLHQFSEAGLLRELAIEGPKMWFDTNMTEHHHFLIEEENTLVDIPTDRVAIGAIDSVPEGMEIERVEVVVRLRRKKTA